MDYISLSNFSYYLIHICNKQSFKRLRLRFLSWPYHLIQEKQSVGSGYSQQSYAVVSCRNAVSGAFPHPVCVTLLTHPASHLVCWVNEYFLWWSKQTFSQIIWGHFVLFISSELKCLIVAFLCDSQLTDLFSWRPFDWSALIQQTLPVVMVTKESYFSESLNYPWSYLNKADSWERKHLHWCGKCV